MSAVTVEEEQPASGDTKGSQELEQHDIAEEHRPSKQLESGPLPSVEVDNSIANAVKPSTTASRRNSFLLMSGVPNKDEDMESDSPVNDEPRKQDSSEHQADRPITFIR